MTSSTSTEIATYQQSSLATRATYAQTLAGASDLIPRGLFDKQTGRPSPQKILLVMETGAMLGLAPMAAIAGIDVIEGKAAISPRVALGLFRSAGHKVKIIEEGTVETGDLKVTVILTRKDDPENPIEASFTPQQALRAQLIDSYAPGPDGVWVLKARSSNGKVLPWEAYTEDLCLWRAVGRLGRRGGQDVLMGIGYIPEELDALVDEDGVVLGVDAGEEQALIDQFKAYDDKADMARVWLEQHPMKVASDLWTERVAAEFAAHLSTLTKDSRENAPEGAPGHTGDADVDRPNPHNADPTDYDDAQVRDGRAYSATHEAEKRAYDEQHAPEIDPQTGGQIVDVEPEPDEPADEPAAAEPEAKFLSDEEAERLNYEAHLAEQAAAAVQPEPASPAPAEGFKSSALEGLGA